MTLKIESTPLRQISCQHAIHWIVICSFESCMTRACLAFGRSPLATVRAPARVGRTRADLSMLYLFSSATHPCRLHGHTDLAWYDISLHLYACLCLSLSLARSLCPSSSLCLVLLSLSLFLSLSVSISIWQVIRV